MVAAGEVSQLVQQALDAFGDDMRLVRFVARRSDVAPIFIR